MCFLMLFRTSSTHKQVGDKASSSSDADTNSPPRQLKKMMGSIPADLHQNVSNEHQLFVAQMQQQLQKSPPVWQRTILMGERCQRPTFSGLVLYDEKGNPLPLPRPHAKAFHEPTF